MSPDDEWGSWGVAPHPCEVVKPRETQTEVLDRMAQVAEEVGATRLDAWRGLVTGGAMGRFATVLGAVGAISVREFNMVIFDELADIEACSVIDKPTAKTYGPPKKGKKGKVKRW